MKISLNWIKEFVDIPAKYTPKMLAELLTIRTCEVEGYEDEAQKFSQMVAGKIVGMRPHPNADKLRLADTDIGGRTVQIVCGGVNLKEGMIVAVALPSAVVNWHGSGEVMELKETKIRGEASFGMICAGEEIGLPPSPKESIMDIGHLCSQWNLLLPKPGTPLAKALGMDDVIFEIDNKSLTHRPDLWGHYGMAREFAAIIDKLGAGKAGRLRARAVRSPGKKLRPFVTHVKNPPKKGPKVSVKIQKIDSRWSLPRGDSRGGNDIKYIAGRFLSTIITGIKVAPSPEWMQKRLRSIGMRPVNNIVDITNFVMHELGHPLHAFDRSVVENDTFVIRFAKKSEIVETLDHKKRTMHEEDVLVTNGKRALGIAGVIGGLNSEITQRTAEIVLEVAAWNPILIRKTAQRHNLRSDAAQRFEKSLDPEYSGFAFHRACELILQICPGSSLSGPATDFYPVKTRVRKLTSVILNTETVRKKIGVPIPEKEMAHHLKALEFGVHPLSSPRTRGSDRFPVRAGDDNTKSGMTFLKVEIPTFRATKDINIEDDLVEEITRMHGYEKIPPLLPVLPIRLPHPNHERSLKHETRRVLSLALGFDEVNLYSFYGLPEIRNALLPQNIHMEIENPLTSDQTHLRVSLLPNMLKAAALNAYHHETFKLYEVGRTYLKGSEYFPKEEKFICGLVAGQPTGRHAEQSEASLFYSTLAALQSFFHQFHVTFTQTATNAPPPYAHPSKCASIKINNTEVAIVYEVHPQVLKNFGLKLPVAAFELNFTRFASLYKSSIAYRQLSRFPGIEIDVSVLVPARTPVSEIQELIRHTDQTLITDISLIDIFEDKSLGPDKKSFTFRILLQSPDRTLTDDEMKQVQQKIFRTLQHSGFSIRGEA